MITTLANLKKLNIIKTIFVVSLVAMFVSLLCQVLITNNLALKSNELNELSAKKQDLEKQIAVLEFEDSSLSSLSGIETKAKKLGFVKMIDGIIAIKNPSTAAAY